MKTSRSFASLLLVTSTFGVMLTMHPSPVLASCMVQQPLPQALAAAPVVFVGRVLSTTNQARTARVRVLDVWRGAHVVRRVVVNGSPARGQAVTTVDRTYTSGATYLFVPVSSRRASPYDDNVCSATRPYNTALVKYRPGTAHPPIP